MLMCMWLTQDESSRVAMCENQQWMPLVTLVGLLTCAVPVKLKAEILRILAAFAKTPHIASAIWQSIESAQVSISRIPIFSDVMKLFKISHSLNANFKFRNLSYANANRGIYFISQNVMHWFKSTCYFLKSIKLDS